MSSGAIEEVDEGWLIPTARWVRREVNRMLPIEKKWAKTMVEHHYNSSSEIFKGMKYQTSYRKQEKLRRAKMKLVRKNCFETNSSSSHVIVYSNSRVDTDLPKEGQVSVPRYCLFPKSSVEWDQENQRMSSMWGMPNHRVKWDIDQRVNFMVLYFIHHATDRGGWDGFGVDSKHDKIVLEVLSLANEIVGYERYIPSTVEVLLKDRESHSEPIYVALPEDQGWVSSVPNYEEAKAFILDPWACDIYTECPWEYRYVHR